jgi:uncharacterized protein YjiS (DUF1127 family)
MLKNLVARAIGIATEEWLSKRTVNALHHLNERTLKDIGITRSEVEPPARRRSRNLTVGTVHTELPPGQRMSLSGGESNNCERHESARVPAPVNGRR